MFGNLAAFVSENQQMCAGIFGSSVRMRLTEDDRDELLAVPGAGPFGPKGRPMKEYIAISYDWRNDGVGAVDAWIDRAVA
jgi:hypothetical protein